MANTPRSNRRISAPQVFVVDSDGTQLGVMTIADARRVARHQHLDLVEVAANANPPVCRVMDTKRFAREQAARRAKTVRHKPEPPDGDGQPGGKPGPGDQPRGDGGDRSPRRPTPPAPSTAEARDLAD